MDLIFTTNDPVRAAVAQAAGVRRIMVDLERHGKIERQGHRDTWLSPHRVEDIQIVRAAIPESELMVRINPLHRQSGVEIEHCVRGGADVVMLPMFESEGEVEDFVRLVGSAMRVSLLVETPQALSRLENILYVGGIGEVHIGLNDLHLGMKLDFMFELLSGGLIDHCSRAVRQVGVPFGFGGIAPVGEGLVPAELVAAEHVRLGSNQVFLSRAFSRPLDTDEDWSRSSRGFSDRVAALIDCFEAAALLDAAELMRLHLVLRDRVGAVIHKRR